MGIHPVETADISLILSHSLCNAAMLQALFEDVLRNFYMPTASHNPANYDCMRRKFSILVRDHNKLGPQIRFLKSV